MDNRGLYLQSEMQNMPVPINRQKVPTLTIKDLLAPVQDFPPSSFQFPTNRQLENVANPIFQSLQVPPNRQIQNFPVQVSPNRQLQNIPNPLIPDNVPT